MRIFLLILVFSTYPLSENYAQIYKWTDKSGNTHFGDQPHGELKEEKISVSSTNSMKEPDPDYIIQKDMNELIHKAEEMNREAKSCYYYATNKQTMDISCKNFETLLNNDFKPLIRIISDFLNSKPAIKNISEMEQKLDEVKDIAKEADDNYFDAIKYLKYIDKYK